MSGEHAMIEYSGVLQRAKFASTMIELLFHPWAFDAAPGKRPVLRVSIRNPALQPADLDALLNEGVEVSIYPDRIELWRETDHGQFAWPVEVLSIDWQTYEIEDFAARVTELETAWQRKGNELRVAQNKVDSALRLSRELIRRAEAKAELSAEMQVRQDEAIRVLQRVIRALDGADA